MKKQLLVLFAFSTFTFVSYGQEEKTTKKNKATKELLAWSGVSIILLILSIGILVFYHAKSGEEEEFPLPKEDPIIKQGKTKSMGLVTKYFWIVSLLMVLQM